MSVLDSLDESAARATSSAVALDDPLDFVFAGVELHIHPHPDLRWTLNDEHRLFRAPMGAGPVAARVDCVVAPAPELERTGREIRCRWNGDAATIDTNGVKAEIRRLGEKRYAATALVRPGDGCSSLLTAVAGSVGPREGALVFHASGVEVDGRAVLFIGPSGAGKTTAANHCDGARWLARDRAIVYPTRSGWFAAGMCGGDPIHLAPSPHRLLELAGILRVRRGRQQASLRSLDTREALFVLRESLQAAPLGREGELSAFDALLRLHAETSVGELRSVLGGDLTPVLVGWMDGR
jgi:hypothetical protein